MTIQQSDIAELNNRFISAAPEEILRYFLTEFGDRLVLASSLGVEDQVLTHMAVTIDPDVRVFVLDTGRLHNETYDVLSQTKSKYDVQYEVMFPDFLKVEEMVADHGINLFYDSVANRKQCCQVRKVEPLQRVLSTCDAWVTGLRRGQSVTRSSLGVVEWDDANEKVKLNPLAAWTEDEVWAYVRTHEVPTNVLHQQGYPSIGCAPCTRAIEAGEDVRAGRWWWELPEQKECGLHWKDGKLVRNKEGDE